MPFYQHNENINLFYRKIGNGNQAILAFHGFSRNSKDFEKFEHFWSDHYTIYALDLFYHGKTKFNGKAHPSFSKAELKVIMEGWIEHLQVDKFCVMGYSMGGRVALFMLEQFPEKLDKLLLLAPDGIKINFWNWWVANTYSGKYVYGITITNPKIVYGIGKIGKTLKILPNKINKFLDINFGTKGIRLRIYRVWQLYKSITFKRKKLGEQIKYNNIEVYLLAGKKDPVIPLRAMKKFHQKINAAVHLEILEAGHDLFKPHLIKQIAELILPKKK